MQGRSRGVAPPEALPIHSASATGFALTSRERRTLRAAWGEVGAEAPPPPPRTPTSGASHNQALPRGLTLAREVNSWVRVSRRAANSPARRGRLWFKDPEEVGKPCPPEALSRRGCPALRGEPAARPDHTLASLRFVRVHALAWDGAPFKVPSLSVCGQGIQRLGKGRFVSKSSSLAAATRGPPCHCRPPRYHRGGQSAREGQDLPSLDLLPAPRWTLRRQTG